MAKGLIFSVSFVNGPEGTTDADFFIDPDKEDEAKKKNICAIPYGIHFLLVNQPSKMYPRERSYDPWWDNKLFDKTTRIDLKKGSAVSIKTAKTVSHYCESPSPGKSYWDPAAAAWKPSPNIVSKDRKRGNKYYSCDNYPGYTGPAEMRRKRGHRGLPKLTPAEVQELARQGGKITTSDGRLTVIDKDKDVKPEEMVISPPVPHYHLGMPPSPAAKEWNQNKNFALRKMRRVLSPRQITAGSFLDPSAFLYLGCGNSDEDHCVLPGAECSIMDELPDGEKDDDDDTGDNPITTTAAAPAPDPTPAPAPAPTPHADCAFWDSGLAWQFEIYNIQGWVTDGGKSLKEEESGCGALTFWTWEDATGTKGAQVHFYLPFFIKSGCVERAIVSAGGPKIACDPSGVALSAVRIAALSSTIDLSATLTSSEGATKTMILIAPSPIPMPTAYLDRNLQPIPHEEYIPMNWGILNTTATMPSSRDG